jgi:hypothetical protein
MAMFAHLGPMPDLADFKRFRGELSTKIKRGLKRA